ncbi:MAG: sulfotransferase family 2 domain-containing protein [Chloroflexi bacterium]|nr:sulfotransferase family 2 domain-containing protein [Chloroflexota bacterium]
MIITDRFVYIHMPKTGGTFVETVLRKIHEKRGDLIEHRRADQPPRRRSLRDLFKKRRPVFLELINLAGPNEWNQHGRVSQIPPEHRDKPVLTTLRNPYDRYVSQYEFKWWQQHPETFFRNVGDLKTKYPQYPDISFAEFVEVSNTFSADELEAAFRPTGSARPAYDPVREVLLSQSGGAFRNRRRLSGRPPLPNGRPPEFALHVHARPQSAAL